MVVVQNRFEKWKGNVKNAKVAEIEAPNIEEWGFMAVWILGTFKGFIWKIFLVSKTCSPVTFIHTNICIFSNIQTPIKIYSLMPRASNLAILLLSARFFYFWYPFCVTTIFLWLTRFTWPRHAKSLLLFILIWTWKIQKYLNKRAVIHTHMIILN